MSKKLNNEALFRALSDVDDKFIEEALNYSVGRKKARVSSLRNRAMIGSIAAVAIAVIGGIVIFNINNSSKNSEAEFATPHNDASQEEVAEIAAAESIAAVCDDGVDRGGNVPAFAVTDAATEEVEVEVDSNSINGLTISIPSELGDITTRDYEYSDGMMRVSYFDANGELLLEIYRHTLDVQADSSFESGIEYLDRYEAVEVSEDITMYRDDDSYLGAVVTRNDELIIVRSPMGVSEGTLQTIIGQI